MKKNLVISSGGIIIYSLIGSLKCLNNNNLLNNINSYYGISAGSILCSMLAIGYSIEEIEDFFNKFNIKNFINDMDINHFLNNYGLSCGNNRDIIAQSLITYKLGENNLNYTFKELYEDKNIKLNIFATCLDDKTLWKFSHNSNENIPIWKAIVASSNIPFILSPIEINNKKFVDGALINNYPINFVPINELDNTIGILYDKTFFNKINIEKNLKINYYINILLLLFNNKYNYSIKNTIRIILPKEFQLYELNFNILEEEKKKLFNIGFNITKHYIYMDQIKN
jgi:NTE family protein